MYLTVKQQLKHLSKQDYKILRLLSHTAKNLANEALYNNRQYYFNEHERLSYQKNYFLLKHSKNYKLLNSNMSQQILKEVDSSFKSFFALRKLAKQGKISYKDCHLPKYYRKDGFMTLVIGFIRIKDNILKVPMSNSFRKEHKPVEIRIPPILVGKKIKEIRIIPKQNARFFEIQYTYECDGIQRDLDRTKALAIDFGVTNFATCVTNTGDSFIIDGRKLKSYNQWFNKENARLQSIHSKQHKNKDFVSHKQYCLYTKRNSRVNDYISKAAKYIVYYCLDKNIGNIVCGYNVTFQYKPRMGNRNNQVFVNLPFGKFRDKLTYLCKLYGVNFVKQEESYTSKASFFDDDVIPVYNEDNVKDYTFSGKRIHRGLYETSFGKFFNADVNGALNILRKSSVVDTRILYGRGEVNTPVRIRIHK